MIQVIATVRARGGQRDALVNAFREILPEVRAKAGCRQYVLAVHLPTGMPGQAVFDPDEFAIVEQWDDLEALEAHIASQTFQAWYRLRWHLVAGASMQVFDVLA